ncbi:hypothetical protein [Salinigranum marinum]|uniref:hypothetical protein n=1 Tax=Salinigranum marinum TaxID=1515595 RepID=UPI002989EEF4|nr:hypothetical protein [Salinigranum marinum]
MSIVEIGLAFVAAAVADLRGNETTRPFTRRGFFLLLLIEMGLSLSGLESTLSAVVSLLGGVL